MRIAILGATSEIAKDLILSFAAHSEHELTLYARRPAAVRQWLNSIGIFDKYAVEDFTAFSEDSRHDAVVNFVGVGNPLQAAAMGAAIFDVTLQYDQMALDYLRKHRDCRYLFLSSGAAYGSCFDEPVSEATPTNFTINHLKPQDWYGVAKLHAECRHRALAHLPIIDMRVFNYFSHTQDMSARFLVTDILRALLSNETFVTSNVNIVRDYMGAEDLYQMTSRILTAPAMNCAIDCYTKAPVGKMVMLAELSQRYGLKFLITTEQTGLNATGIKTNYYSRNYSATQVGYSPTSTSLEVLLREFDVLTGARLT
jgi:nucleoside-diphosphate-sugar epimerase